MTPEQALDIAEQVRLQVTMTGAANDQFREAIAVLRKALGSPTPSAD